MPINSAFLGCTIARYTYNQQKKSTLFIRINNPYITPLRYHQYQYRLHRWCHPLHPFQRWEVFVFVQSLTGDASQNQILLRSFALFFFVFFLFLFAGKLLLSNLTVLKTDSAIWFDNLRLQKDKINKTQEWENEITKLKLEIDEQRIEKWKIVDIIKIPEAELKRLNERREMLVKLFESEFNLARSYRGKLTGKQIEDILK